MRECSHDLCEFKSGRLTPCIFKVLLSAKSSRFKREISAPLSGLWPWPCPVRIRVRSQSVSASSPRPRPQFVRVRAQFTFVTCPHTCPCPVRDLTVAAIYPCPCPVHDRAQSESLASPCPVRSRSQSASVLQPGKIQVCPRRCPPGVSASLCERLLLNEAFKKASFESA